MDVILSLFLVRYRSATACYVIVLTVLPSKQRSLILRFFVTLCLVRLTQIFAVLDRIVHVRFESILSLSSSGPEIESSFDTVQIQPYAIVQDQSFCSLTTPLQRLYRSIGDHTLSYQ